MGAFPHDSPARPAGGRLGADLASRVEAIVHAAEREARAAEQAIAEHRRSAEEEVRRYLAAARLQVDAETAARAARIETLSTATRRLAAELTDAVAALARELHTDDHTLTDAAPRPPWPPAAPAPPAHAEPESAAPAPEPSEPTAPPPASPEPTWSRIEEAEAVAPEAAEPQMDGGPSAARLVAIEMAVGGSSRAEVEQHLRDRLGVAEPEPLLDDVFGVASHAGSRLAWGEP
jgi:hypothetical protein